MGRTFHVRSLAPSQLAQAYPLVQAIASGVTLEAWLGYARAIATFDRAECRGVVSAAGEDGYLYGLFCYAVEPDLRHGRTLIVENMVVLDIVDRRGATAALAAAIDRIAHQMACAYVHVTLPHNNGTGADADRTLFEPLTSAGHAVEGIRLCKRVAKSESSKR